jgi:hypothetical protein
MCFLMILLQSCSLFTKTEIVYVDKRIVVKPPGTYMLRCEPIKHPDMTVEDVLRSYKESILQCNTQIEAIDNFFKDLQ